MVVRVSKLPALDDTLPVPPAAKTRITKTRVIKTHGRTPDLTGNWNINDTESVLARVKPSLAQWARAKGLPSRRRSVFVLGLRNRSRQHLHTTALGTLLQEALFSLQLGSAAKLEQASHVLKGRITIGHSETVSLPKGNTAQWKRLVVELRIVRRADRVVVWASQIPVDKLILRCGWPFWTGGPRETGPCSPRIDRLKRRPPEPYQPPATPSVPSWRLFTNATIDPYDETRIVDSLRPRLRAWLKRIARKRAAAGVEAQARVRTGWAGRARVRIAMDGIRNRTPVHLQLSTIMPRLFRQTVLTTAQVDLIESSRRPLGSLTKPTPHPNVDYTLTGKVTLAKTKLQVPAGFHGELHVFTITLQALDKGGRAVWSDSHTIHRAVTERRCGRGARADLSSDQSSHP
jgi:hypothetical protein